MKELLLDSVYTVEPKHEIKMWNDGHWNYQWSGRSGLHIRDEIKWRKEGDDKYIVCDADGKIWCMDKLALDGILAA